MDGCKKTLAFSLPYSRHLPPPNRLHLSSSFLDDTVSGGPLSAVLDWFSLFTTAVLEIGLRVNVSKCELIFDDETQITHFSSIGFVKFAHRSMWELLGSPIGSASHISSWLDRFVDHLISQIGCILRLPLSHHSFVLLRLSCGFASVSYTLRTCPAATCLALVRLDDAVCTAFESLASLPPTFRHLLQLPIGFGGFGLRSCVAHATSAYHSSLISSIDLWSSICSSIPTPALAQPQSARHIDRALSSNVLSSSSTIDRARLLYLSTPGAGAWLVPPFGTTNEKLFLTNDVFSTSIRLRLGIDVFPEPSLCRLCNRDGIISDTLGTHALVCVGGGLHTLAHNAVRDLLVNRSRQALLNPVSEHSPCPGARLDFVLRNTSPLPILGDVSLICQAALCYHGKDALSAQSSVKRSHYTLKLGSRMNEFQLCPFVCCFGISAFGPEAFSLLRFIAHQLSHRTNIPVRTCQAAMFNELSLLLLRRAHSIILASSTA